MLELLVHGDPAPGDDDHPAADRLDLGHDVGREQDRVPVAQLADQGADLADLDRVEAGGRLVEDQDVGVVDHRLGQPDPLAKASREVAEDPVLDVRQPAPGDHLADRPPAPRAGHVLELGPEAQVLPDPHLGVERHVLGQVADLAADLQRLVQDVVPGQDGPAAGRGRKVVRIRIVVVLPAPLGPSRPTISPRPTSKLIWSTALTDPYCFVSRSTWIMRSNTISR